MDSSAASPLLVVILGPTASGKTSLSLALARRFEAEIVNCDSVAMFREFEVGTAKPNARERLEAPHHLIDCAMPSDHITAGEYARQARMVLEEIKARKRLPIVVGGTGLYLKALLEGLFVGPQRSEELRERLRKIAARKGKLYLHQVLGRIDGPSAQRIHAHDLAKIIRAIEVCLTSRQKVSDLWHESFRDPLRGYRILRLGLEPDRQALYARINQRAERMFESGLIEETNTLRAKYGAETKPLGSLGYRQAMQFLNGELTRQQAVLAAQQTHRNYAKRQITWFRREPEVLWLGGFGDDPQIQEEALAEVKKRSSPGFVENG